MSGWPSLGRLVFGTTATLWLERVDSGAGLRGGGESAAKLERGRPSHAQIRQSRLRVLWCRTGICRDCRRIIVVPAPPRIHDARRQPSCNVTPSTRRPRSLLLRHVTYAGCSLMLAAQPRSRPACRTLRRQCLVVLYNPARLHRTAAVSL